MENSYPFNSVGGDRKQTAKSWQDYFSDFIGNGVYAKRADNLQVLAGENMTIQVATGSAFINGVRYALDESPKSLTIGNASGINPRIDRVVIRLDNGQRKATAMIIEGEPKASPSPPSIIRDGDIYDLSLATILVGTGATAITQADITDTRFDRAICGVVAGVIDQIDTSGLFKQYEEEWQKFKNQLSGDVGANIQLQINEVSDQTLCHILGGI